MSKRSKSPHGRTSDRQLRAEDSSDDLRRYQECAKKLDECSKNLLRLCQVSGELNNLNDDDIERAANEIIRTEEEEAKKIAAELLHQKGLLHRNLQDPEVSATGYLNQEDCGPRPRSGGAAKSNTGPSGRRTDYEVPKTLKNQQQQSATDQRPNVHQQVINQPPYAIIHCEERVPCQPCPSQQYSNSGMSRSNPCADYSSSQLRVPTASTPYVTKGDGSERRGPPYFRQAQQQPAQSTWNRPEPVWNPTVSRKTDPSGLSNSRLLDQCKEQARKMNEMTQSSTPESTKRGAKPQTIHLTAGAGRSADPPVHIVITAIANDCDNHGPQQQESYPRAPVYSDNEFAEESAYSLGNKGPSTIYSSPTGDDCVPQKYLGSQQKLVDRGCDAYNSPDDVNPSSSRPTYKEILDTILSQRPHDAESLLKSKGILNCAIKCWENTKNNLRAKSAQQTNSRRGVQYQTIYECQEQTSYPSQTQSNGLSFPQQNRSTEWMQPNPRVEYSQSCTDGPVKPLASTPGGSRQKSVKCPPRDLKDYREQMYVGSKDQVNPMHKTVILKCCQVPTEAKSKQVAGNRRDAVQSRPGTADMMETLRQYRTPAAPTPCRDRKNQYEEQQFLANPIQTQFGANPPLRGAGQQYQFGVNQTQFGANPPPRGTCPQYQFDENTPRRVPQQVTSVPKTYQCIQICPPSSNPSSLLCAPAPPVNRMESKSKIQSTASEMDSSILLAIAKAAINLSLEKQQQECEEEEEEFDEDCDSGYPDILDSIFKE